MSTILCDDELAGKTALVTGGLGGVGRETVLALVEHGIRVVFTYADGHEDPTVADAFVAGLGGTARAVPLDLMRRASIDICVAAARDAWGRLDILVNNAAVGSATVAPYGDTVGEQDSAMLRINAEGTLAMCQAYLDLPRSGLVRKIINISSIGGGITQVPGFRLSDGMSKAAVAFLTRALAAEHVHTEVDVFAVCPGATDTRMLRASTLDRMSTAEQEAFVARLPKRRLIEPVEIARLVLFLCTRYAAPLHGSVIDASMGLGVRPGLVSERPITAGLA